MSIEVYSEYGLPRVQPMEMQSGVDILLKLANP
jgi:hypothetical protein